MIREIPLPSPTLTGNADADDGQPELLTFLLDLIRDQGDSVRYETPFGPVFFFNHPDDVQSVLRSDNFVRTPLVTAALGQGLLTSDGDWWQRQRKLMQPHFREHCLSGFAPVITDKVLTMLRRWDGVLGTGRPLDVTSEMRRLALEAIVGTMFGAALEGDENASLTAAFATIMEDLGGVSAVLFKSRSRFRPSRNAEFKAAVETLDRMAARLISDHRKRQDKPRDFLSLLLNSRDEKTGLALDDRQLRDEVVTMLTAGHEASANVLGWVWPLLAEHPAVERQLRDEVARGLNGRVPSAEDLAALPYTRIVLEETMRLYPPVWFMMRRAVADDEIGGLQIPAGAVVLVSPYTTHRHRDFWESPEEFNPERFLPERKAGRHAYAHFPFAGGRHHCLGHSFAIMETQLVVALIAQRCEMQAVPGHRIGVQPLLSLRQQPSFLASVDRCRAVFYS